MSSNLCTKGKYFYDNDLIFKNSTSNSSMCILFLRKESKMGRKRGQQSAGKKPKNYSAEPKASKNSDEDSKPIQESHESQEPKLSPQQKEVEAEPDKVVDKGETRRGEKSNDNETDGQSKKGKKKKNKKQDDKADDVDGLVNDIEKPASKQEKLWKSIEDFFKDCPEPIFDFFKNLAYGKHWTFLTEFKKEDLKNVLDSCKV